MTQLHCVLQNVLATFTTQCNGYIEKVSCSTMDQWNHIWRLFISRSMLQTGGVKTFRWRAIFYIAWHRHSGDEQFLVSPGIEIPVKSDFLISRGIDIPGCFLRETCLIRFCLVLPPVFFFSFIQSVVSFALFVCYFTVIIPLCELIDCWCCTVSVFLYLILFFSILVSWFWSVVLAHSYVLHLPNLELKTSSLSTFLSLLGALCRIRALPPQKYKKEAQIIFYPLWRFYVSTQVLVDASVLLIGMLPSFFTWENGLQDV